MCQALKISCKINELNMRKDNERKMRINNFNLVVSTNFVSLHFRIEVLFIILQTINQEQGWTTKFACAGKVLLKNSIKRLVH